MAAATQTGRFTLAAQYPTQNTAGFFQATASIAASGGGASVFTVAHGLGAIPDFVFHNVAQSSAAGDTSPLKINIQRDSANISVTNTGKGSSVEVEFVAGILLSNNR